MKYLGLIGDDAAALEMTIAEESKKLELAVAELNRRTFFQLCALLPPDKEKDMIRIFQGVWDEM